MGLPWTGAGAWIALALAPASAQNAPEAQTLLDPYTRGEPAQMQRLGYHSFGPFRFVRETTGVVQARLGGEPILWVETEHYLLGSTLEEYQPDEPRESDELKRELAELRRLLPRFPAKPKRLDPWLRVHLFARRLERLHADFRARLGVLEGPGDGVAPGAGAPAAFGMKAKLTVLLTQKQSTLARFTHEFCGRENGATLTHHFGSLGTLFYGRSDESLAGTDADLHYAVVHGVAQNLLCAIHGFPHQLPAWWQHGVALWFARALEPRVLLFVTPRGEARPAEELCDWEPLARGRVAGGACLGWDEMLARASWVDQAFGDNVVLWARVDYLLRQEGVAHELTRALHEPGLSPPHSALALEQATGHGLDALDRAWSAWVLETYRKKRL